MPHTVTQFDADLEALYRRVLLMGGLVEAQLYAATEVLAAGDMALAAGVIEQDHQVNAFEVEIDGLCATLIARRQPAANDLRMVMAVTKVVTDLERVGDEAEKIARLAMQLHGGPCLGAYLPDVLRMAKMVRGMLLKALDALARQDAAQAERILQDDACVDEQFRSIFERLVSRSGDGPNHGAAAVDVLWVAKALERIGDHTKNVAQSVIYLALGTDVRHTEHRDGEQEKLAS